jgi:hypothetical protein
MKKKRSVLEGTTTLEDIFKRVKFHKPNLPTTLIPKDEDTKTNISFHSKSIPPYLTKKEIKKKNY